MKLQLISEQFDLFFFQRTTENNFLANYERNESSYFLSANYRAELTLLEQVFICLYTQYDICTEKHRISDNKIKKTFVYVKALILVGPLRADNTLI